MAKKPGPKQETKSDFLRRVLGRNPNLEYRQVNQRWAKAGHPGEISNALYYAVRRELGIRTEWVWVKQGEEPAPKPGHVATGGEVYRFKITLLDAQPPIWRRIEVGDCTLDQIHELIQTAMGWTNLHLHHFRIGRELYGDPMLMEETFEELGYGDSTATRLSQILPAKGGRFRFEYEYDFGDSWNHEILFEGRGTAEEGKRYPLCVDGERACPPEDVGGVWGYQDFLATLADPTSEDYHAMREWCGGRFDSEAFSPAKATARMHAGLPDWRRMR